MLYFFYGYFSGGLCAKVVGMSMLMSNKKAQNLIEYALIVAVIASATVAMSTYVYRAVQSKQKEITELYAQ